MCRSNQDVFYNVLLLRSDDPGVQENAASALESLALDNEENQNAIREAGAIPLLTKLLSSDVPNVQHNA